MTSTTIAKRRSSTPPRTLSAEEQARAAQRLMERTEGHQSLVSRMAQHIGDDAGGRFFEDEFSFDMLWVPDDAALTVLLFEMKTVTSDTDAHARVRSAVGQLSYYEYFHAAPRLPGRKIRRVVVVDADVPDELRKYLTHEGTALVHAPAGGAPTGLTPLGRTVLEMLPASRGGSARAGRSQG